MKLKFKIIAACLLSFNQMNNKCNAQTNDTIPIIFHLIHANEAYGTGTNLDSAQINSQFEILNNDFNGSGFNLSIVPSIWQPLIAQTGITFVPALYDTQGNLLPEKGIDRISYSTISGLSSPGAGYSQATINNIIKPATIWDVNLYCNVWIVKMTTGLFGYSTFPDSAGFTWIQGAYGDATNDGIVINYKNIGDTLNVFSQYNKGRTLTHEMGHWLGLIHMNDYCSNIPYLQDIWPANYNNIIMQPLPHTYPLANTECVGDMHGAMFMNFMCSDIDSNLVMFTKMQGDTMKYALHHAKYKHNLESSWVYRLNGTVGKTEYSTSKNELIVYPNPSSQAFYLKSQNSEDTEIIITDLQGRTVKYVWDRQNGKIELGETKGCFIMKLKNSDKHEKYFKLIKTE